MLEGQATIAILYAQRQVRQLGPMIVSPLVILPIAASVMKADERSRSLPVPPPAPPVLIPPPAPARRLPSPPPPAPPSPRPAGDRTSAPRPVTPAQGWITEDDYPFAAVADELSGVTNVHLAVDADGFPTDCTIPTSTAGDLLDRTTCDLLMARALFTPARNAQGDAVAGVYVTRVRWVMPEREPIPEATHFEMVVDVDATGEVTACEIVAAVNLPRDEVEVPEDCPVGVDYLPATNEAGERVARRFRVTYQIAYEAVPE